MIQKIKQSTKFHLAITPEGTRSANPNWKKGFYYIAAGADIPIILVGIDYQQKCIFAERYLYASGDIEPTCAKSNFISDISRADIPKNSS